MSRLVQDVERIRFLTGRAVALVGPTGAGKTTIAKLMTRFYEVVDGRVLIDDIDVRDVTQALIQRALDRLLAQRTAVVIAHRLSTIRNADVICVVQDGRIVQQGRHAELVAQDSLYRTLYRQQLVEK